MHRGRASGEIVRELGTVETAVAPRAHDATVDWIVGIPYVETRSEPLFYEPVPAVVRVPDCKAQRVGDGRELTLIRI
jgi:hypothetical protein